MASPDGYVDTAMYYNAVNKIDVLNNRCPELELRNCPNPFNSSTRISSYFPVNFFVTLTIHDITGREIAMLEKREFTVGVHETLFDAKGLASGVYICRLSAKCSNGGQGEIIKTRKILLQN